MFAPLVTGGTAFDNVRVDYKGTISLPYAGRVKVAGLDPQQVEDRLRSRLAGVTFEPQVYVELISDRGSSVLVSGEVKAAGRFSHARGSVDADRCHLQGRRRHQAAASDRRRHPARQVGEAHSAASVMNGEQPAAARRRRADTGRASKVFNALGAVKNTGQIEFRKPNPSLLDALAQVGGLDPASASTTGVFVFRLREPKAWLDADNRWQEGPVIFKFDMSKPEMMFIAQAFGMRNDDTIYVTNAPSVEWVKQLQPIALTLSTLQVPASNRQNCRYHGELARQTRSTPP